MTENVSNENNKPSRKFNFNRKTAIKVGVGVTAVAVLVVAYRKNVAHLGDAVAEVEVPEVKKPTTK